MARKRAVRSQPEVLTRVAIKVADYEVCASATINHDVRHPQYAVEIHDEDPLFEHVTRLTIRGNSTYPPKRAGHLYEFTIYGDDAPSKGLSVKLRDAQVRGEYGVPQYRRYRGREIPVYRPPSGYGLIQKVRGEQAWTGWATLAPRLVTDMLIVLGTRHNLYLEIGERKTSRARWVESISLQTTDPAEE